MSSDQTPATVAHLGSEGQKAFPESERLRRLYETILATTPDLVYVFGLDHRFVYANAALLAMWGRTWDDAIGKTCLELGYEPWHAEMHDREIEQVVASKKPIRGTVPFNGTNGRRVYDYIFTPVLAADGEVEAVAGTTRDVTDRMAYEDAMRESEARYRSLFESMDEGFCVVEILFDASECPQDYRFVETNPAFERQSGMRDALGKTVREMVPGVDPLWISQFGKVLATGEPIRIVQRARTSGRWFEIKAFRIGSPAESKVALLFSDVTHERTKERALQFLVDLEGVTRTQDDPVAVMSTTARLLSEHLGADRCAYAEVDDKEVGFTVQVDFHRNGLGSLVGTYPIAAFGERILAAHRVGETFVLEDRDRDLAGPEEYDSFLFAGISAAISVPIRKRNRLVASLAVHAQEPRQWTADEVALTEMVASRCWAHIEQVRVMRAWRESADQYRQIAEGLPQMVWSAGADGTRDYFNARWLEYTGVGLETSANPWSYVLHPDDRERAVSAWNFAIEQGRVFQAEYRLKSRDDRYRWFLGRAIPLHNEEGEILRWFGTCTDIHDQKATQNVLQITNDFAVSLAQDLNLDRIVQSLTDASTAAIGAEFGSFFYTVTGETGDAFLLYTLSGAPIEAFEGFGLPRATAVFGPTFRGEGIVRSDDITKDPRYGTMAPHFGMPEGHLPVVSYLAVPVTSRSGEVMGGLFFGHSTPGVFTEEHERIVTSFSAQAGLAIDNARLYERVRGMNEELEQKVEARTVDLLSAIEQLQGFTYHVSHDLRAPLRGIASTSRIIQEDFGAALPPEVIRLLGRQAEAATKLGRLVDDLLKLSRLSRQEMVRQPIDMTELARDAAAEALSTHPYTTVQVEVAEGLNADGDPRLLRLALMNLIENAVKYSPHGGTVKVGQREDGTFFVTDQGIGMDNQYLRKIFEPFQRLHRDEEFSGTGIGLASVQQVIERHGGTIWAESIPGQGSVFLFTLG